jgi:hypothetical protein
MTVTEFRAIYPKYACREDAEIQRFIDLAECYCPLEVWDKRQSFGISLLVAHFLECAWQQDVLTAGMAVALGQSGNASLPAMFEDTLTQTTYGREYKLLWSTIPVAPIVVL